MIFLDPFEEQLVPIHLTICGLSKLTVLTLSYICVRDLSFIKDLPEGLLCLELGGLSGECTEAGHVYIDLSIFNRFQGLQELFLDNLFCGLNELLILHGQLDLPVLSHLLLESGSRERDVRVVDWAFDTVPDSCVCVTDYVSIVGAPKHRFWTRVKR